MSEITNLQFEREQAGLTICALAELSGVTRQTISNIEKGSDCRMEATARKLCDALNCTSYDLFGF